MSAFLSWKRHTFISKLSHARGLEEHHEHHGNINANCYWIFHACHTLLEEEPIATGKQDYKENQEESHQGVDP